MAQTTYILKSHWKEAKLAAIQIAEKRSGSDAFRGDTKDAVERRHKGLCGEKALSNWYRIEMDICVNPDFSIHEKPNHDPDLGDVQIKTGAHRNPRLSFLIDVSEVFSLDWANPENEVFTHVDDTPFVFLEPIDWEGEPVKLKRYVIHGWCFVGDLRKHKHLFGLPDAQDLKNGMRKLAIYVDDMKDAGILKDMNDMTKEQWLKYLIPEKRND
jgi:hypothetical protein